VDYSVDFTPTPIEHGDAIINVSMQKRRGVSTIYLAVFTPQDYELSGTVNNQNFEEKGVCKLGDIEYKSYLVSTEEFKEPSKEKAAYDLILSWNRGNPIKKEPRKVELRLYWKSSDPNCRSKQGDCPFLNGCYVLIDRVVKDVAVGT